MSRRIHEQLATLCYDISGEPPNLDVSTLPVPTARHRRVAAINRAQGLANSDLAGKLEILSGNALDRAGDILELDISDDEHEKFGEKVRGLNAVIKTVLQTQVRVDEHRLKARSLDVLPALLELIKQEEGKREKAA